MNWDYHNITINSTARLIELRDSLAWTRQRGNPFASTDPVQVRANAAKLAAVRAELRKRGKKGVK